MIVAGHYRIMPRHDLTTDIVACASAPSTLFPVSNVMRNSATKDDEETMNPVEYKRYSRFILSLGMRDRRCIVTGNTNPDALIGAHIIPHAWRKLEYVGLPSDMIETLLFDYDEMGINDMRNG